ncbi:hypothetical protein L596_006538 [Steinernema carpocapsae]|uniref:Uncharacterized protein n=1 Tax=Steinernema carpocapsae TaxID=34508 RepID=A0A4U8V9J8_STECR|nr:hypothetical protein L596_006538 [Steinernema carpocapsae]
MLARRLIPFSYANVSQRLMRTHTDKHGELYIPHHHPLSVPTKIIQRFKTATSKNYSAANTLTNVPNDGQFGEMHTALKTGDWLPFVKFQQKPKFSTWLKLLYMQHVMRINLQEKDVEHGSKIVFGMLFQNMFKNTVGNLTNNAGFHPDVIKNVHDSVKGLSKYQRKLFNITADDIIDVRTEKLETFRHLKFDIFEKKPCAAYVVVWHAFYKRHVLAEAVKKFNIYVDEGEQAVTLKQADMPSLYGYSYPRLICANMTFLHFMEEDHVILKDFLYATN